MNIQQALEIITQTIEQLNHAEHNNRVAAENTISAKIGTLANLSTTAKVDLVTALNEVKNSAMTSTQVMGLIDTAVAGVIGGAPETYNTLREIADYMATNESWVSALRIAAAGSVRFDITQGLTTAQQQQARSNLSCVAVGDAITPSQLGNIDLDWASLIDQRWSWVA